MRNGTYIDGKIKALNEVKNYLTKKVKECFELEENGTIQRKIGKRAAWSAYNKALEKVNLKLKRIYDFEKSNLNKENKQ